MSKSRIIRVCVAGVLGRMGRRVCAAAAHDPRFQIVGGLDPAAGGESSPAGVHVSADSRQALVDADLVVDFSAPAGCRTLAPLCAERGLAYLVGSTALTGDDEQALVAASRSVPVLAAANFSIAVNLALELVETAARRLGPAFAVELMELHHGMKRDAPSGTARELVAAAQRGRGELKPVLGRQGVAEPRGADELGIAALRGGDVPGEHTVYFLGDGERLEISHRATTPEIFARGALVAGAWLVAQSAGRYSMRDVVRRDAGA
jgi:4-hydroxy-tetrahydrodipicolinate reductase